MDGEKEGKDNSSKRDTKRYLSWPMIRVGKKYTGRRTRKDKKDKIKMALGKKRHLSWAMIWSL